MLIVYRILQMFNRAHSKRRMAYGSCRSTLNPRATPLGTALPLNVHTSQFGKIYLSFIPKFPYWEK